MSVAQVKKQFEEMAAYLGRDAAGLGKLRQLKDAVNVIRTNLAAAAESEQRAIKCRELAVAESNDSKTELAECRLECQRLHQKMENLTRRLADATASIATEPEDHESRSVSNSAQFAATIRELRKQMKTCPPIVAKRGSTIVINRSSIAKGWSRQDMWTLGAAVAVLSAFDGETLVLSDEMIRDIGDEKSKGDVLSWLKNIIGPIVTTAFDDVCSGMIDVPPHLRAMGFKP